MRIAVLIKQVPATDKVKMDEKTGTMIRSEMESELNPLDMYAVEEAVRIKERLGKKVYITVISMGPSQAVEAIKDAISMGCDDGYLLSDRQFAGADTFATAYTLSAAIRKIRRFELVFTGERATDGETGQVGPSVAAQLDIPVVTYVSCVEKITDDTIRVQRLIEGGHETIEVPLPALLSVVKEINEPRIPNLAGKMKAKSTTVLTLTADQIGVSLDKTGLSGSPTRVVKMFYPKLSRDGRIVRARDVDTVVDELIEFMRKRKLI